MTPTPQYGRKDFAVAFSICNNIRQTLLRNTLYISPGIANSSTTKINETFWTKNWSQFSWTSITFHIYRWVNSHLCACQKKLCACQKNFKRSKKSRNRKNEEVTSQATHVYFHQEIVKKLVETSKNILFQTSCTFKVTGFPLVVGELERSPSPYKKISLSPQVPLLFLSCN